MQLIPILRNVPFRRRARIIGAFILVSALSVFADPTAIPTPSEQAVEYHNLSNIVWGVNQFLALILMPIALLVLASRIQISTKLKFGKYPKFVLFATIFFTLSRLVQFPLDRIRTNKLNQINDDTGLPILQWFLSQLLQSLPLVIVSILAALFVFWLINRSPQKWWLSTTGVFSFLFLLFLVVEPFTISHKPLGHTSAEVRISALAEQIGIPKDSIVLEDCEPFDSCEIAHVSGLGPTRLILLNKGLFDAYPETWAVQSFAHESKHFVKDDNFVGWIVMTLILLVFFFFTDRISRTMVRRFSRQLGFTSIAQPSALALIILILNIMYLSALPPVNMFRQHVEFEADRFGLELTHESRVLTEMASSWTTSSTIHVPDPSPFFMLFRSSHPSDAARITFANEFVPKGKKE
ncbi:MAG: M48 family metalloprotease [Pyrinomonadaceae bacterium]